MLFRSQQFSERHWGWLSCSPFAWQRRHHATAERLSAALNLILTFFAKVKVGLDLGVVSVMETVWHYDKSPDPLKLAQFDMGAKGRVRADAGGARATMKPEYRPPDLSIETLKKALKL